MQKSDKPRTAGGKRGAGAAGRKTDNEEVLLAKIRDLEDELKFRDQEY